MSRPLGRHLLVSFVAVCLIASGLIVLPSEVKPASGAAPATPKATLVSQSPTGEPANASSQPPVISADGRYVAFASFASNLVEGDTNDAPDVFLYDRATGTTKRIFTNAYLRLSLESLADNANGWEPAGSLVVPTISDDGRFVAALACPGETPINWEDVPPPGLCGINLYNTQTEETKRIAAFEPGEFSWLPNLSGDGKYLTFVSCLLADGSDDQCGLRVYNTTTAETAPIGSLPDTLDWGYSLPTPSVSADGQIILHWECIDENGIYDWRECDVLVTDRSTATTSKIPRAPGHNWVPAPLADGPSVSANGDLIVLTGQTDPDIEANRLVSIFVYDRRTGNTRNISESLSISGIDFSASAAISPDGRYIAFWSVSLEMYFRPRRVIYEISTGKLLTLTDPFGPTDLLDNLIYELNQADPNVAYQLWELKPFYSSDEINRLIDREDPGLVRDLLIEIRDLVDATIESEPRFDEILDQAFRDGILLEFLPAARLSHDGRWATLLTRLALVPSDTNEAFDVYVVDRNDLAIKEPYIKREPRELYGNRGSSGYASDPVNTATGNYTETNSDLEFGVSGLDHARTYNAMDQRVGPMGRGWSLNNAASLNFAVGASMEFNDADGRVVTFVPDGTGGYTRPEEMFADLVKLVDDTFELRYFNGETWAFDANGTLVAKNFWDGQSVSFSYDSSGQLVRANHSTGLVLDYEYENQRLVKVVSSDGRSVAYSYDPAGNLSSATDPTGAITQYQNDALGLITKVIDPNGHLVIQNTYDEQDRVIHQVSGSGNSSTFVYDEETGITTVGDDATYTSVRYAHDPQGRLISITDIYGAVLTKTYDASGNLIGSVDRRGQTAAKIYDARGNQVSNTETGGITESFEYDSKDRLISSTNALGDVTRYSYVANNRLPSSTTYANGSITTAEISNGLIMAVTDADGVKTTYEYDSMRNLISTTDALANKSSFGYDAMGNQTSATSPLGHKTTTAFDKARRITAVTDPLGALTRYEYSPKGDLTKIIDPTGAISTYSYDNVGRLISQTDANGAITKYVYDSHDNLIETHGPNGAITKSSFDAMGRLLSSTDAYGGVTRYEYDAGGNTTKVIDPTGAISSRTLDDRGREIESIDAHGQITRSEYDALDRVIASIDPTGARTQTVYDPIGNVTETIDALGAKSIFRYSGASRVIETIDPKGNSTKYRYDNAGRQIGVIDPLEALTKTSYDADGNVASMTSPTGLVTKFSYDPAGRQSEVRNPRGGISKTSYSLRGEVLTETDPTGATKRYSYDASGNLITAGDANGGITKFGYDLIGNQTSITDQLGNKSLFTYDLGGQMISKADPLGRVTTFTYDQRGMLSTIADPSGRSETRAYNALGQLSSRIFGDGTSVQFVYDQTGRRTEMTDSTGTTKYSYDPMGRLVSRTYPDGYVVSSTFDQVGNRSSLTYPDGTTAIYSYDGANRLVGMEHPLVGKVTYKLDLEGRLISESFPSGGKTKNGKWSRTYGYTDDLMTTFTDTRGALTKTTTFGYDQAGRVTTEKLNSKTKRYSYDQAGQLLKITGPDSGGGNDLSFSYDGVGNRTAMTKGNRTTKYVYDPAKQLTSFKVNNKTTNYTYDQAGRRIKEQRGSHSVTSTYDQTGAVSSITTTDGNKTIRKESRAYDGDGVLVRSTTEEQSGDDDDETQMITENRFRWDTNTGIPEILTIDSGSTNAGSTTTDLFYGYGRIAAFGKNKLTMFSKDAYGSTISFGNNDQFVTASSYDPWGNPTKAGHDDDDDDENGPNGPSFGYRSEMDLGDGDIYLRARNYDPTTGRFTTVDPLDGVVGELTVANPYHYANNDPLNQVDPLGLRPVTDAEMNLSGSRTSAPKAPKAPTPKAAKRFVYDPKGNAVAVPENWDNMTQQERKIFVALVSGPEALNAALNPKNNSGILSIIKEIFTNPISSFKAGISKTPTWFWVVTGAIILVSGGFIACFATGIAPCVAAGNTVLIGGQQALDVTARAGGAATQALPKNPSLADAARLVRDARPVASALKSDTFHRAATWAIDDIASSGSVYRYFGSDGIQRTLVQVPGKLNGIAGRFEWIVDSAGNLTHQIFVKGGSINGIPIKP